MTEADQAIIAQALENGRVTVFDTAPDGLFAGWLPIASSADPADRRAAALTLWNDGFTRLLPNFMDVLRGRLLDVRICRLEDDLALVYLVRDDHGDPVAWVGWDPRSFGEAPALWDNLPATARAFLREVHAGFTGPDGESYGITRPRWMETYASRGGDPAGLPDWDEESPIPSTRLLVVTSNSTNLLYCVSPDLPAGQVALVYEGDVDAQDFGAELDELLVPGWPPERGTPTGGRTCAAAGLGAARRQAA